MNLSPEYGFMNADNDKVANKDTCTMSTDSPTVSVNTTDDLDYALEDEHGDDDEDADNFDEEDVERCYDFNRSNKACTVSENDLEQGESDEECDSEEEDGNEDDDDDDSEGDDSEEDFSEGNESEYDSSSDDEDYEDLMAEIPVSFGRKRAPMPVAATAAAIASSSSSVVNPSLKTAPAVTTPLLTATSAAPTSSPTLAATAAASAVPAIPNTDSSDDTMMTNPMEGLQMLQNIRSDLEKLGRMIVSNKDGEKFLQRAHILASINYLANNVPQCLLEDLGVEIRKQLEEQNNPGRSANNNNTSNSRAAAAAAADAEFMASLQVVPHQHQDSSSDSSKLSFTNMSCDSEDSSSEDDDDDEEEEEDDHDLDFLIEEVMVEQQDRLSAAEAFTTHPKSRYLPGPCSPKSKSPITSHKKHQARLLNAPSTLGGGGEAGTSPAVEAGFLMTPSPSGPAASLSKSSSIDSTTPPPLRRLPSRAKSLDILLEKQQQHVSPGRLIRAASATCGSSSAGSISGDSITASNNPMRAGSRRTRGLTFATPDNKSPTKNPKSSSQTSTNGSDGSTITSAMVLPGHEVAQFEPKFLSFECALLFVDISGFTRLSTLLDPESLSKVINNYFQVLVDKVFEFGGDIQKFAGDALFAEWRASSTLPLAACCEAAGACASSMVKHCADFSVMAFRGMVDSIEARGTPVASLNVHCGLGLGQMTGLHIGDNENRREYLYLGRPIVEATGACDCANLGEVAASKRFCEVLAKANLLSLESLSEQNKWSDDETFAVLADRNTSLIETEHANNTMRHRNAKSRGITDHVDGLQLEALIEYRRLMSLYVHPVVVSNDVAAAGNFNSSTSRSKSTGNERHIEDAELRSAYVMFIKPLIPFDAEFFDMIAESNETTKDFANTMNDIMNLTSFELKRFNGHLRQFIADDKGLVLIATFGLRGSTFPNMVGERALPATIAIYNALYMELGIDSRIGATFGDVYCGAVGGIKRNEYAVMGPSVNLAARLMTAPNNPGILVDDAVRKMGCKAFGFAALPPVAAKGYKEPVKIFEPLSPLKHAWAKIQPNFVGREQQIATVLSMAANVLKTPNAEPKLAVISASSGMGKSTLLAHIVEYVRKSAEARNLTDIIIAKHVGNESDAVVPFHAFGQIFLNLITEARNAKKSVGEISRREDASSEEEAAEMATQESIAEASDLMTTLCADLGAPPGFADHVKRLVFGMDHIVTDKKSNAPSLWSMASFLAHSFHKLTQSAPLVLLGLDDVHHCEEMSWIVLRKIFNEGHNVLMVATACSATSLSLEIEPDFLEELEDTHLHNGRFVKLEIGCLTKEDVVSLITKTLDMEKDEVSEELLNEVYTQSLGLPLFANEILTKIKNRSEERTSSMTAAVGQQTGSNNDSVVEIILHRIDSFDIAVRDVLNVAAIIGSSFTISEMIAVLLTTSDRKEDVLRTETKSALMLAVKEGVLKSDESADDDVTDETVFSFNHELWKSTLLGLMLHSRKRDVHRKIAQSMESREEKEEQAAVAFRQKLYEHWLATGNTAKATTAALQVGRLLEREGKPSASVEIGKKTLQMWGWDQSEKTNVGGIAPQVLKCVGPEDLSNILRLIVALGRASTMSSEFREGVTAFEDALRIMQSADASNKLKDRSIIFPAFTGLSDAIAHGHITQDVYCRYEQAMLHKFLQETRIHGRLIHHIHALYLQMNLYGRQGEFDKAIAVQSVIKSIYKIDRHSKGLCNVYDQDSGALSFSVSSLLCLIKGDNKQALRTCRFVLKELLPKLHGNMIQTFALMYPLVLVLKESGYSAEARGFFEKVVVQRFSNCPRDHPAFYLSKIFEPLIMLLRLTDTKEVTAMDFDETFAWAISHQSLGPELNLHLARLGWSADTVLAEICAALSKIAPDARRKEYLTKHGTNVCFSSMGYLRRNGLKIALQHVQTVHSKLRSRAGSSDHGTGHGVMMVI